MKNKIIFLDIDGVLNSVDYCNRLCDEHGEDEAFNCYGGFRARDQGIKHETILWDIDAVHRTRTICEATEASIVISSTWGKTFTVEQFREMFRVYGWDAPIQGITVKDKSSWFRGDEINWTLEKYPLITQYCIIDDDSDFHEDQKQFFVKTSNQVGITDHDVTLAINILTE